MTASEYLCPNLHTISKSFLKIPDNLAGLTILAFGNSAPDIFSTYEAMKMKETNLALAELIGASFFVSTCVIGCIGVVKPFEVPQYLFGKDVVMYILVYLVITFNLITKSLNWKSCLVLILLYLTYVSIAIIAHQRKKSRMAAILRDHRSRGIFEDLDDEIYGDETSRLPTIEDIELHHDYEIDSGVYGISKLIKDLSNHSNLVGTVQLETDEVEIKEVSSESFYKIFCPQLLEDIPLPRKVVLSLLLPITIVLKLTIPVSGELDKLLVIQTFLGTNFFICNLNISLKIKLILWALSIPFTFLIHKIDKLKPEVMEYFKTIFGTIISITYISFIATEIISILRVISTVCNLSDDLLGITLFALGNSIGDFITNYTMAQLGFPIMAFAACFGGPLLALCSFGFSGLIVGGTHELEFTEILIVGITAIFLNMIALCVMIPKNNWQLDERIGKILVLNWVVTYDETINQLKYHLNYNSIGAILEDLIKLSIKSNSRKINIKLDLSSLSTFLQNDGNGFTPEQLERQNHLFGAISNVSIISKCSDYKCPYMVNGSSAQLFDVKTLERSYFKPTTLEKHGTIYIINNIFNTLPVRKEQMKTTSTFKILNNIKLSFLKSLIETENVTVSFSLYNPQRLKFEEQVVVNLKERSLRQLMKSLFELEGFKSIRAEFKNHRFEGIIGLNPINSKSHQYIFINGVLASMEKDISNKLNEIFNDFTEVVTPTKTTGRPFHKFPVFLIYISSDKKEIPNDSYTWEVIVHILTKIFQKFVSIGEKRKLDEELVLSPIKKSKTDKFLLSTNARLGDSKPEEVEGLLSIHKSDVKVPNLNLKKPPPIHICHCHDHSEPQQTKQVDLTFGNYRIIRQIDKKFILLLLDSKLVILDQHASDERVKVEELMKEYISTLNRPSLRLATPIPILISKDEKVLLNQYKENFELFGIIYHLDEDLKVYVTYLPEILITKCTEDWEFLKNVILQHGYDLQNNSKLVKFDMTNWFQSFHNVPRIITEIINSKACRSAIMFGDELDQEEITTLIERLSKCKLPFQCAHGRPSIIPLASIK
ncbi:MLH3 [Candida pseudojiufengensis]|uniref:MLH3 n=1 Tax=Candida pseudojiufengensis TaxID=497109 RepID=UPI002224B60E|nr:MLH3 [Candida pseudojiufengensis]KAI5962175.1 MLH3 [Candida pseudojiufengensis]